MLKQLFLTDKAIDHKNTLLNEKPRSPSGLFIVLKKDDAFWIKI